MCLPRILNLCTRYGRCFIITSISKGQNNPIFGGFFDIFDLLILKCIQSRLTGPRSNLD
jgi:hypothetical protein